LAFPGPRFAKGPASSSATAAKKYASGNQNTESFENLSHSRLGLRVSWPKKKKRKRLSSADKIVILETHRMGQQATPPSGYVLRAREQINRNQASFIAEWSADADR
jgi:hypothetical protein